MAERKPRGTALIVESDEQEGERLAGCLEDYGFEVTVCPGPSGPDYTCVGVRTLECPLATGASVVVLDTRLDGDDLMEGASAEELLNVYLLAGHRVIALGLQPHDEVPGRSIRMHRHPEVEELISAVGALATVDRADVL
jgi:hypothetical protein